MYITIKLFGSIRLIYNENEIDLEVILGKQLSSLFAFLLCHRNYVVTKDVLIENIWPNSDNPNNALKYAIHRLRNALAEIEKIPSVEWIVTAKNGYRINEDIKINIDVEQFEKLINQAKQDDSLSLYYSAFNLFEHEFLSNLDVEWILLDRSYYKSLYLKVAIHLASELNQQNSYIEAMEVAKKAISFDSLNDELIYE